jgi:DNA-binding transcriptional LysR family regulator
MHDHMDWDGVRVFLAVARAGRLSVAARQLGVEHTTVGRRLAALEDQLGAALFYRTAAGYRLTPAGESVLASAEAMRRAAAEMGTFARERTGIVEGQVRLALVPEFASHWLAPRLPAFQKLYPSIELQVLVGTRQLDLSRGEAELAVRSPHPRQTGLVAVRIARATAGLYASKAFVGRRRLRLDEGSAAEGLPLLVYTPKYHGLQNAAWFQPVLERATIVLRTNSTEALLAAARASAGIAVLPRFVARRFSDLVPVSADVATNDVWLITHPEYRRDPKVRVTGDFLKQAAAGPTGLDV